MAVSEWDQRLLCSDGACIGVIGGDGTCKVCGRAAPNWGDERNRGLLDPPGDGDGRGAEGSNGAADGGVDDDDGLDDDDLDDEDGDGDGEYEDGDEHEGGNGIAAGTEGAIAFTGSRAEWTVRELCSDGACIGVIGDDGRCKVCGRAGAAPAARRAVPGADAVATTDDVVATTDDVVTAGAAITTDAALPTGDADAITPPIATREHCADASCTGAIGGDGRCDVCGRGAS